jgi:hypothetical protein
MSVILFMLLKKKPVVYKILTSVWVDLISSYPFVMALQTFTHYLHRDKSAIINLYYPFNYLIMKQSLLNNTVYSCRQKTSYYIDGITIQINTRVVYFHFVSIDSSIVKMIPLAKLFSNIKRVVK